MEEVGEVSGEIGRELVSNIGNTGPIVSGISLFVPSISDDQL